MSLDLELYTKVDLGGDEPYRVCLYETSYTDNIVPLVKQIGLYECVWRGSGKAGDIIEPIRNAIDLLKSDPKGWRCYDSPNGCGNYDSFLPWLKKLLEACLKYPKADIKT